MKFTWIEPNREHPLWGIVTVEDGGISLTANVAAEGWEHAIKNPQRARIESRLVAHLEHSKKCKIVVPPSSVSQLQEKMRTAYANLNEDGSITIHGIQGEPLC